MRHITDQFLARPWLVCLIALGAALTSDQPMAQGIALFVAVVCVIQIGVFALVSYNGNE